MSGNNFLTGFFEKTPGKEIQLDEFPSLLSMQGHQGACGAFFSALWFGLASVFAPDIWTAGGTALKLIAGAIILSYFVLSWASFSSVGYFSKRADELKAPHSENPAWRLTQDHRVRAWMTFLSGSYALICSVLIWLTGGAISPFTPFYVMIFTLTITKIRISQSIGFKVLGFFLFAVLVACVLAESIPAPIEHTIKQSGFQIAMHILFIAAALIVPTISQYLVERREAQPAQSEAQQ